MADDDPDKAPTPARRALTFVGSNLDVFLALALAVPVSVLDVVGTVSTPVVNNVTMVTLAVLALAMLTDRLRRDSGNEGVRDSVRQVQATLDLLPSRLAADGGFRVLNGAEIGQALADARRDTDRWVFKGSTATYVRAVTLPECVDRSRRARRPLHVRLEILDPTDVDLCERYIRMFQSLASTPDAPEHGWTVEGTRRELFATILAACWYKERFGLLDIAVGLSSTVTTLRWEESSDLLVVTRLGPRFPAVAIDKGQPYFDLFRAELHTSLHQARRLPLDRTDDVVLGAHPDAPRVRAVFGRLGITLPDEYDDQRVDDLVTMALHRPDPYGGAAGATTPAASPGAPR